MKEFQEEYAQKTWEDYRKDGKLEKLMDRTVENILTALIEVCGTVLTEEGIEVESYGSALRKCAELFGFPPPEQEHLASLAIQRNRLAHQYLNFKWQTIKMFKEQDQLVLRLLTKVLEREDKRTP